MQPVSLPPINIPSLLRQYNLRPSKGLGQNFLQDERALQKIVTVAGRGFVYHFPRGAKKLVYTEFS